MKNIIVLVSGNGTNLQAIIDAINAKEILNARISIVISNKPSAFALSRASSNNINSTTLTRKQFNTRLDFDIALAQSILNSNPNLIVLAGFMHILSKEFLDHFPTVDIINVHPALPGMFDGINAIERALDAFKSKKIEHTGVMVHKVVKEVDRGEVVVSDIVEIKIDDTLANLEERMHKVEHKLLIKAIQIVLGE